MVIDRETIHAAIREAALDYWGRVIIDTDGSAEIEAMFHRVGWSFHIPKGYRNSEKFAWCGIFAGACASRIGEFLGDPNLSIDRDIIRTVFPSTYRLNSKRKWEAAAESSPEVTYSTSYYGFGRALIPGAIATVATREYGDGRDEYGGHIVIVDKYDGGDEFWTIEGNAHGRLGDYEHGEGVIRTKRNIADLRRVYLLEEDHVEHMGR